MALYTTRVDVGTKQFPFLRSLHGRSAVVKTTNAKADNPDDDIGIIFCENALPINEGLKAIDYTMSIPPVTLPEVRYFSLVTTDSYADLDAFASDYSQLDLAVMYNTAILVSTRCKFARIIEVIATNNLRAYIGVTVAGYFFINTATSGKWELVDSPEWTPSAEDIDNISSASLLVNNGTESYICLPNVGVYKINIELKAMVIASYRASSNIVHSNIKGICTSFNYLILHDGQQLQWSSAFDPLDFNLDNSVISGTGFGVPLGLQGSIVCVSANASGYTVYSDGNAINADWSGNTLFPWVFNPIPNSAGVKSLKRIVTAQDDVNYVWTSQGLQALKANNAEGMLPELSDFLSYRKIESYNYTTNQIEVQTYDVLLHDIGYCGDRWFVFSYGTEVEGDALYLQALVYDSVLKRWGKLVYSHVDSCTYRAGVFNSPEYGISLLESTGKLSTVIFNNNGCPEEIMPANILSDVNFTYDSCSGASWEGTGANRVAVSAATTSVNLNNVLYQNRFAFTTVEVTARFTDPNPASVFSFTLGDYISNLVSVPTTGVYTATLTLPAAQPIISDYGNIAVSISLAPAYNWRIEAVVIS